MLDPGGDDFLLVVFVIDVELTHIQTNFVRHLIEVLLGLCTVREDVVVIIVVAGFISTDVKRSGDILSRHHRIYLSVSKVLVRYRNCNIAA